MTADGALAPGADGIISAAYLVFYGSGQIINGFVAMKLSPRQMIPVGLVGSGVCNLLMTAAGGNTAVYVILWAANGFFCSMLWPSVIRILTRWMTKDERERSAANVSPSIPVGSIVCYLISFLLLDSGWKNVFICSGIALCAGGMLLAVYSATISPVIRGREEKAAELAGAVSRADKPKMSPGLIVTFGLWIMMAASFFNGTLKEAVISWVPKYLSQRHGVPGSSAALISTLLPAVSVAGPYFAAFVNRRFFDNECTTVALLMGISCVSSTLILVFPGTAVAVVMLSLSSACMWGVNTMLMTYTTDHFSGSGLSTAVSGVLNGTVFAASALFTFIYGRIADGAGWDITVAAWAVMGALAAAVCFFGRGVWARRRPEC